MSTDTADRPPVDPLAYEAWLDGLVGLKEGAGMRSVSIDTLKRTDRDKFVCVGERALRIRRRDALRLPPRRQTRRGR